MFLAYEVHWYLKVQLVWLQLTKMSHTQVARLEVEWSLSLLVRLMKNDLHQRCPVNQGVLISGVLIRGSYQGSWCTVQ